MRWGEAAGRPLTRKAADQVDWIEQRRPLRPPRACPLPALSIEFQDIFVGKRGVADVASPGGTDELRHAIRGMTDGQ